jgi:hypothetical protein
MTMKKIFLTFFILMSFAPALAYAQSAQPQIPAFCTNGTCTYTPLEPLPGQLQNGGSLTFSQYLSNIFTISIVTGAMVAVAVLVFSGITYMMSEALPSKDWGKRKMKQALWALLILLGSYLILSTINPSLVVFSFGGQVGGNGTPVINPLGTNGAPNGFIKQTTNGTAASGTSLPSGAQVNQQTQTCPPNTYTASITNGTPSCQPYSLY